MHTRQTSRGLQLAEPTHTGTQGVLTSNYTLASKQRLTCYVAWGNDGNVGTLYMWTHHIRHTLSYTPTYILVATYLFRGLGGDLLLRERGREM